MSSVKKSMDVLLFGTLIPEELQAEIDEVYCLGARNGWHNNCLNDAIQNRIMRYEFQPAMLERSLRSLLATRRAAVSMPKDQYMTLHPEKEFH